MMVVKAIGVIASCFKERFGIPRQAGLVPSARAFIKLDPELALGVRDLSGFSHLWVLTWFHARKGPAKMLVKPPRLGGDRRVGVFSSRSPYRPNPIGLSVVRLIAIHPGPVLEVEGGDFLDETPVIDIKPYLPYADAVSDVHAGWVGDDDPWVSVRFSNDVAAALDARADGTELRQLIVETLRLDPRPSRDRGARDEGRYGCRLADFDVQWRVDEDGFEVIAMHDLGSPLRPIK